MFLKRISTTDHYHQNLYLGSSYMTVFSFLWRQPHFVFGKGTIWSYHSVTFLKVLTKTFTVCSLSCCSWGRNEIFLMPLKGWCRLAIQLIVLKQDMELITST